MSKAYDTDGFKNIGSLGHSRNNSLGISLQKGRPMVFTANPPANIMHIENINAYARDTQGNGNESVYKLKAFLSTRRLETCKLKKTFHMGEKKQKAIDNLDRHQKMKIRVGIDLWLASDRRRRKTGSLARCFQEDHVDQSISNVRPVRHAQGSLSSQVSRKRETGKT